MWKKRFFQFIFLTFYIFLTFDIRFRMCLRVSKRVRLFVNETESPQSSFTRTPERCRIRGNGFAHLGLAKRVFLVKQLEEHVPVSQRCDTASPNAFRGRNERE